ncbi:hypothetical protein AJ87_14120 [Rhizobium yanglingense]|nr:hypothetical protein AJ87_14120 [Rhizobium yanglingense]
MRVTQGKLAGTTMKLRQWQIDEILSPIYAEDDEGNRQVRTAVVSMGRKNGKTFLSAALAYCALCWPEAEERGEVYFAAIDKLQASKAWAEAKAMLERHPELSQRVNIIRFSKEIEVLEGHGKGSVLKAVSADADSKLGMSPSFVLCDEAGYWPNRDLFDVFDSALGARDNPLIVIISTQAKDDTHFFMRCWTTACASKTVKSRIRHSICRCLRPARKTILGTLRRGRKQTPPSATSIAWRRSSAWRRRRSVFLPRKPISGTKS